MIVDIVAESMSSVVIFNTILDVEYFRGGNVTADLNNMRNEEIIIVMRK